ncbi:MAG: hypothetical protein PVJ76_03055 [Gemmatimonadota bacterium]
MVTIGSQKVLGGRFELGAEAVGLAVGGCGSGLSGLNRTHPFLRAQPSPTGEE